MVVVTACVVAVCGLTDANRGLDVVRFQMTEQVHRRSQNVVPQALEEDPALFGQVHGVVSGIHPVGGDSYPGRAADAGLLVNGVGVQASET